MIRKIIVGGGIFIIIVFLALLGYKKYDKSHSPLDRAEFKGNDDLKITLEYCRPYKKGRLIFGEKMNNALQPYGVYWRVGANEATTIELNKNIRFNGKPLNAGKYQIYAVPQKDVWHIYINREWDRWGAREANHETDVLETEVPANNNAAFQEQMLLSFDPKDEQGNTHLNIHWDKTLVKIPISAN